jgi:hypothetical protein
MNWEELFRDYLTAVYNGDHIEAQKAINELKDPEHRVVAQDIYDALEKATRDEWDEYEKTLNNP